MRKTLIIFISIWLINDFSLEGQSNQQQPNELWNVLASKYEFFRYNKISDRRFKHEEVMMRLEQLEDSFRVNTVGQSVEGKPIKLVSWGTGPTQILMWSQMHGNEPTATMALMDVFNWLESDTSNHDLISKLQEKLTVHFIPMLNPDGADRFTRRNAQHIDINRDALRQQTPEGRILKQVRDSLEADWGFNLHDQGRTTAAGDKPATLSFLAPAFDEDRNVNEKREDAMQLIAALNVQLQQMIPGQVGRYWDEFEPRAFGDNIQKWGTRTILIESGGQYRDRDKQQIRKLNFLSIISSLVWIADQSFEQFTVQDYFSIMDNSRGIRDVIIKNVQLPVDQGGFLTDIGIDFNEIESLDYRDYYLQANVTDLGDLSTSNGYIEYDMKNYEVRSSLKYDSAFETNEDLLQRGQLGLLKQGYTHVIVESPNYFVGELYLQVNEKVVEPVKMGANPGLLFYRGGQLKYALVNGYLIDINLSEQNIISGKRDL